ncbi:TPA: LysR family transcriptional regulator [Vibrio vulnificus]|nr:LysR family transcriptional regulator [Vibrio vulnificus]HAT8486455.1 LysR family transcriptional regulator [Vibrio vulnificus]HAT8513512.1 LysR family transcriptional regulator [Vibrio vulnificus]
MNIKELDLNLLRVLRAIVETKNSHTAAEKLGISQTSVSRAIAKLKENFGEQLFIRKAHGMEPSDLAIMLAKASLEMLHPVEKVMEDYAAFAPNKYSGKINILVNTFLLEFFGPQLILALHSALPKASFHISQWQKDSLYEVLQGGVDYVIQLESYTMPQDMFSRNLAKIDNVLLARKNHPILSKSSNWDAIHPLPIVRLYLDGINPKKGILEQLYERHGYQANFLLTTHSIRTAVELVKTSDAILYSSQFVCQIAPELECYSLPPSIEQHNALNIAGSYLQTRRGSPFNQYLHQTIQTFFDQTLSTQ